MVYNTQQTNINHYLIEPTENCPFYATFEISCATEESFEPIIKTREYFYTLPKRVFNKRYIKSKKQRIIRRNRSNL